MPRTRDLGDGFAVRRALPHGKRQMVGPFIFFDHFGPVQFMAGKGMDVRPHPHIGLATVTYLFDGSIMHRDSEGNIQEIQPGAMNLMTAGRGIAHSERTPDVQRRDGQKMLGLQSWIALPAGSEEIAPSFQHYAAESLPTVKDGGFTARIIAGSGFGVKSPVTMVSPWFYTEVTAVAGTSVPLDADHEERAIYVVDGEVEIAGERYEGPRLLIFRPGDRITVKATKPTRMMFLGGDALEGPRQSGGISSPPARSGSNRPNRTGKPAVLPMFPRNTSSFRCRSELSLGVSTLCLLESMTIMNAMLASDLPLPRIGRGKVRDIYAVGDDRVLLLTTDRISAFDVVMAETIPMKGAVLTQISAWWFRQLEGVVPHHMISADADEIIKQVPALKAHRAEIAGRAMLCRRTTVFPVECVIRGYISGSAWKEYAASGTLAGEKLARRSGRKRKAGAFDLQPGDQGRDRP